jgi:hypothetical protein
MDALPESGIHGCLGRPCALQQTRRMGVDHPVVSLRPGWPPGLNAVPAAPAPRAGGRAR